VLHKTIISLKKILKFSSGEKHASERTEDENEHHGEIMVLIPI